MSDWYCKLMVKFAILCYFYCIWLYSIKCNEIRIAVAEETESRISWYYYSHTGTKSRRHQARP